MLARFRLLTEEKLSQQTHVFDAAPKWRDMNPHDVEPVEQIFAKGSVLDFLLKTLVRRRKNADVAVHRLVSADA